MRIPSGTTDQYIYFFAVDSTDFTTPETGLSSFTVYRSRNGGAAAAMTTPTINETDSSNMAGVYELLLDEDMTIDSGDDEQEMVFYITHAGMAPVVRTITLFRPKATLGETLTVASGVANPFAGDTITDLDALDTAQDSQHSTTQTAIGDLNDPSAAEIVTAMGTGTFLTAIPWNSSWDAEVQSECTDALNAYDPPTNAEMEARTILAANYATASALATVDANVDAILVDTSTSIPATLSTIAGYIDTEIASIISAVATVDTVVDGIQSDLDNATDGLGALKTLIDAVQSTADAIETDTQDLQTQIGTAGDGLSAIPWNSSWDTEVQSEVNDALVANHLDHIFAAAYDPASKPGNASGLLNVLVENDSSVPRFTANALEQAPSGGGGGGGDATEEKQDEILEDLADIKGTGFVKDTNSLTNLSSGATVNLSTEGTNIVSDN